MAGTDQIDSEIETSDILNKNLEDLQESNVIIEDLNDSVNNEFNSSIIVTPCRPLLYNFKIGDYEKFRSLLNQPKYARNSQIKCPEFSTLLDHTLGLVWLLYENKNNIGHFRIHHIEWAMKFLEGMESPDQSLSPDVRMVVDHLNAILEIIYTSTDDTSVFDRNSIFSRETIDLDTFDRSNLKLAFGEEIHRDEYYIPIALRNMYGNLNNVRDAFLWKTDSHEIPSCNEVIDVREVQEEEAAACPNLDETTSKAINHLKELEDQSLQKVFDDMENFMKMKDLLVELGEDSRNDQSVYEVVNECYDKIKEIKNA